MSQGDQDKTEQATPHRLEEARKRGEVAKSMDVTGSVVMVVFAAALAMTAGWIALSLAQATRRMIELAGQKPALDASFAAWVSTSYGPVWQSLTPLLLALLVAAVVGNVFQTGPMFTTHPLKPDFKRMHPMNTIKRVFSMRTLWELGKLVAKAVLLCAVCWLFVRQARALAESVAVTLPQRLAGLVSDAFIETSIYVLAVLVAVAAVDLLFVRREFMRKMRMSRRELRDEVKRRDGDPQVKSKQKQRLRELLKKTQAIGAVPGADVVLTNPTHVAVALRYRPGVTMAPIVVAKGAGFLSRRIREKALRHGVPMMRVPPLARALYADCEIDGAVPERLYGELAPIYRELWAKRGGVPA